MHAIKFETSGKMAWWNEYNNSLSYLLFDKGQYINTERWLILTETLVLDGPWVYFDIALPDM
jgi:hypothetical protein